METVTHCIRHEGREIAFHIRYSARRKKSIAIRIDREGSVICAAPRRTPRSHIMALMEKRAGWVIRHLERFEARSSALPPLRYTHGEQHPYMGRTLPLEINKKVSGRAAVSLETGMEGETIRIATRGTGSEEIRRLMLKWYRNQAAEIFDARMQAAVAHIPWLADDEVPELRIRAMKSRWGSCSARGVVTLNLHLIKAPLECLDYVILHELCHLREHNHGPRFYALLSELRPNWKSLKQQLEEMPEILR